MCASARSLALAVSLVIVEISPPALAQCANEIVIMAGRGDGYFGSAAGIGDVNDDGIPDFAVGAQQSGYAGIESGRVYVFAGGPAPRALYAIDGQGAFQHFGDMVCGLGDIDGDGRGDFAVSAPAADGYAGKVTTFSGVDGHPIFGYVGPANGTFLGQNNLGGGGDVNGDGCPDLVFGAEGWDDPTVGPNSGKGWVYSGCDGSLIYALTAEFEGDRFGSSTAILGDLNGDGFDEFVIGARHFDADGALPGYNFGRAYVYSGIDGHVLFTFTGIAPEEEMGFPVSALGDVNGDGIPDIALGARHSMLASGADGTPLRSPLPPGIIAGGWGVGDFDGDGFNDVLFSRFAHSPRNGSSFTPRLVSGAGTLVLGEVIVGSDFFDAATTPLGDMNLDGFDDWLVGFPDNGGGGEVHIVFGGPRLTADVDASGTVDGADIAELLGMWGSESASAADLNQDGVVDACDLELLFLNWGATG